MGEVQPCSKLAVMMVMHQASKQAAFSGTQSVPAASGNKGPQTATISCGRGGGGKGRGHKGSQVQHTGLVACKVQAVTQQELKVVHRQTLCATTSSPGHDQSPHLFRWDVRKQQQGWGKPYHVLFLRRPCCWENLVVGFSRGALAAVWHLLRLFDADLESPFARVNKHGI